MNEFLNNLKRQAEENPYVALGVVAAMIGSIGKLFNAGINARNSRIWGKEVGRRLMKDKLK